jgi:hypothetical protein
MQQISENNNQFARAPSLTTVIMVEKTIEKYSGEFNRTDLWKKLPKKVMWQTYLVIIDYLQSIHKIAFDEKGILVYIWNPAFFDKVKKRPAIKI